MAVFPDRIVLKNSTDSQVDITEAIQAGGDQAITQGEIVLGLETGDTKLYTVDANGEIIVISTSSAAGRAIVSETEPTIGIGNLPLAIGDQWFNPATTVYHIYSGTEWILASSGAPGAQELTELTDVVLSSPQANEVLMYREGAWQNAENIVTWPMDTRGDLTWYDGTAGAALPIGTETQVLTVVGGNPVWQNNGVGTLSLDDLADVSAAAPTDGQVLVYDSIQDGWVTGSTNGLGTVQSVGIVSPQGTIDVFNSPIVSDGDIGLDLKLRPQASGLFGVASLLINDQGIIVSAELANLEDLGNVDDSVAPEDGQALVWDASATAWRPQDQTGSGGGGDVGELDDLTDVDTSTDPPVEGEVLTWRNALQTWVAATPTGGAQVINDLLDVSANAPGNGQVLTWNSEDSEWAPSQVGVGTVTSVDITGSNGVSITGDPVTDSGTFNVALTSTGVVPGNYFSADINVDAQGRIVGISNGEASPMTADGDMIIRDQGASARLPIGSNGQILVVDVNGLPSWDNFTSSAGGTVTSVDVTTGNGLSSSGGPVTQDGSIEITLDNTTVNPGTYSLAMITVDSQGRITDASSGDISAFALDDLSDVDTTTRAPEDGQVLLWDGPNSRWISEDAPGVTDVDTVSGGTFGSGL